MKIKNLLLILSSFLIIFFFNIARISAASYQVSYTIEKYGSTQTSIADAYFEKPATVTLGQGQYTVSMTVKTSHDLGSFPVQILNVNGQTPQVSKSTSGNEDYYTFTFATQSVKKTMSGNMKVDIDSMDYHHTYGFNLILSADIVPDLTSGTSSSSSTTVAQTVTESSSSASMTSQNNSSTEASSTSSEKTSISNSISSSSSSTSENSASSSMNSSSKKNNKIKKNKKGSKKSNTSREKESKKSDNTGKKIVGGASAVVVALGIGFGIWRRIHY